MSEFSLAKAQIVNLDAGGPPIECMFNPKEYSITKQNQWTPSQRKGADMPLMDFGSGQPATMQMQLHFDTYVPRDANGASVSAGWQPKDVRREYTERICDLMKVDESTKNSKNKKARPPFVRFQWGSTWSFNAVITNIVQHFTLFWVDGTPVRAMLDVTFNQITDNSRLPRQNPTSGGDAAARLWTVRDGDTLAWIAYSEYGDSNRWRTIADANRLSDVRRLRPGNVLEIPDA